MDKVSSKVLFNMSLYAFYITVYSAHLRAQSATAYLQTHSFSFFPCRILRVMSPLWYTRFFGYEKTKSLSTTLTRDYIAVSYTHLRAHET